MMQQDATFSMGCLHLLGSATQRIVLVCIAVGGGMGCALCETGVVLLLVPPLNGGSRMLLQQSDFSLQ